MTEQSAILAGGCFWCTEAVFNDVIGVTKVESGYIGGNTENPTYKQVCSGTTGHAEAIRITFDSDHVGYGDLLDIFFATHDPTQKDRQGNDVGTQYRSAIFPQTDEQEAEANAAIDRAASEWPAPIATTIENADNWYDAEDYHQEYWEGEGQSSSILHGYYPAQIAETAEEFCEPRKVLIASCEPQLKIGIIHEENTHCRLSCRRSRHALPARDKGCAKGNAASGGPAADPICRGRGDRGRHREYGVRNRTRQRRNRRPFRHRL